MALDPNRLHPETLAVRLQAERSQHREHASPLYLTSSFVFDNAEHARALFAKEVEGSVYSRYANPTVDEFVAKVCALEGAPAGIAVASGMSAVFTPMAALLSAGDHLLCSRSVFGSTTKIAKEILPKWGIETSFAPIDQPERWHEFVRPTTKLCYVETPSNPALDLIDLDWLADFCHERGILLFIDNIFATPVVQQPMRHGADLVMHSTTKFMDGQGRTLGGVVVGKEEVIEQVRLFARHIGPALSPFNAWVVSRSLETLHVRMERHCASALRLATFLEGHSEVAFVKYPHLPSHPQYHLAQRQMRLGGGLVTFSVRGGIAQGRRFLDALELCSLTANLGDTRTICTHPASTTHSSLTDGERDAVGIGPGLVRVSVGLEHVEDLIADLDQALVRSRA
ncbi:MAG: aminotransferase class I/II-fold pyridoxal phosphate-dependent enzyme [Bacteroidota bacterium]